MRSDLEIVIKLVQLHKDILQKRSESYGVIEDVGSTSFRRYNEGSANAYFNAGEMMETLEGAIRKLDEFNKKGGK